MRFDLEEFRVNVRYFSHLDRAGFKILVYFAITQFCYRVNRSPRIYRFA